MKNGRVVHLVDDEDSVRRGIRFLLRTEGFEVETYETGVEFLSRVHEIEAGCVLLDVRMPEMDGLAVQRSLKERRITMPVIVMTGHGDITTAVAAMRNGAVDFIEKPFEKAVLLAGIDAAFHRLDPSASRSSPQEAARARLIALTPRELAVLRGLVRGLPNKTIAYDLGISPRTVELHRANLMSKLDARSLSDALRVAFAAGIEDDTEAT
ncbi:response regulator transcription factor [Sphingomonas kyeonggiensis]|uniref:Two-component system response regulator FixJ n=1 Tax=Sphingomonas kyeonggiensis TaxID=1268553 RepID=A0A7W6NWT2_9SPHN|nr:response regulator [Sphingomonas kyeonggiensis]MBB4099439.1 two-component system response regulator FixJ [Sphingomonas kyeonggiensis]MDQ0252441.1 two-component system response regulator FixJ [Sphingomonas kyeonggiensis]